MRREREGGGNEERERGRGEMRRERERERERGVLASNQTFEHPCQEHGQCVQYIVLRL